MRFLPNALSIVRMLAAPYLCLLLWRHEYIPALVVVLLAGLTDGLDGLAARKFQAQSQVGEMLDPIADKLLMGGAFLTLAFTGAIAKWLAVIVIGRDVGILLVAGIALALGAQKKRFPPSWWGKFSTGFQIAYVLALMGALAGVLPEFPHEILKWMVAILTIVSGADYAVRAARPA